MFDSVRFHKLYGTGEKITETGMECHRVAVFLGSPERRAEFLGRQGDLEFVEAGPPEQVLPELLEGGTLFLSDDGEALARAAGSDAGWLAGVVLVDPGLDLGDFGFDSLLVTFLPPETPAAAVRAVLLSIARRLARFMEISERIARNESEINVHHEEQKHFLVEMMKRTERLRRLEENSTDWIWEVDAALMFTYSSPRVRDILGVGPAEVVGRSFADFLHTGEGKETSREVVIERLFGKQERFSSREFIFRRAGGAAVYLETSAIPLFSAEGKLRGYMGVARDVSERRSASARIMRLLSVQRMVNSVLETLITDIPYQQQLEHLLDVALSLSFPRMLPKGAIFTVENGDGVLTLMAQRGFSEEQLKVCSRVPFGTCVCGRVAAEGRIMAASCDDEVHEFHFANAEPHRHYCVPVSSRGRVVGVLNVYMAMDSSRDPDEEEFLSALANTLALIIERNRAEKDKHRLLSVMARSRRLESISRLAAGLAHDLNNILTGISGYAMLTMLDMEEDDKRRRNLEAISASCRRAADLVRKISTFGRHGDVEMRDIHLGGFIDSQQKNLAHILGPGVTIEVSSEKDIWPIHADADLLENILFNLAHNSREAMDAVGRFTLACRNIGFSPDLAARLPGMRPGDYVLLEVEDSGRGIEPEVADLVFDPFFSTSGAPGRGLGLATVYGAMKRLGGNVYVDGRPGEGAVFRLYFPRAAAAEEGGRPAAAGKGPEAGILMIEDDGMVRGYLARILDQEGFRVTACDCGAAALKAGADFDLVISDVVLPDMNGIEVVRELLQRNPRLEGRVLYMSGFLDSLDEYADELVPGRNFIGKPVMPAVLIRAVRRMLEG